MAIPAITNNSPVAGSISWDAFTIQLYGIAYTVPAASSAERWIWWEYRAGAPILNSGPDIPDTLTDDDLLLFANKGGIGVRVQSSNFVDGELLVDGSIFAEALSTNLINSNHIVTAGLDAGVIKFGVMSGDLIGVNTILANRLAIGSFDNLLDDPEFTLPFGTTKAWATGGTGITQVAGQAEDGVGYVAQVVNNTGAQTLTQTRAPVAIEPGSSFRAAARFRQLGAAVVLNRVRMRFTWIDAAGVLTQQYISAPAGAADTWTTFSALVTAPATAVGYTFSLRSESTNTTGTLQWSYVQVNRAMDGQLIVDGSIDAANIVTGGLDAQVIKFGTMSGDRITALTINTGHIVTTGLDAQVIKFGTMHGDRITVNTINSNHIVVTGLDAQVIKFGTMHGDRITANTINSNHIVVVGLDASTIKFGTMSGDRITAQTINTGHIVTTGLSADVITFGLLDGARIKAQTIDTNHISTAGLSADVITFGTMDGDRIEAKTITGEHLSSDVILATSRIAAVGPGGQSVELNPDGFYVYGPTSEGHPAYVSFPTDGGAVGRPNIISGTLQATTLSVEGNPSTGQAATFRMNSQLEPGATLTLNDSVVPPVSYPAVETVSNETLLTGTLTGPLVGLAYHPTENALYYMATDLTAGVYSGKIYKVDLATNAITLSQTVRYAGRTDLVPMGLTYLAGQFYVGYRDVALNQILVARYDTTTTPGTWFQNTGTNFGVIGGVEKNFAIGNDGTNIWIGDFGSTTADAMRFRRYSAALSATVAETINTTLKPQLATDPTLSQMYSLNVGNFDFGVRKFVVSFNHAYQGKTAVITPDLAVFGTAGGARETANEFFVMGRTNTPAVVWSGTSNNDTAGFFLGMNLSGTTPAINVYSKLRLASKSPYWYVGSSFYRVSDGAETVMSPQMTMVMNSRWGWKVTVSTPPVGLVPRVYISQTALGAATARLQATLAAGVTSVTGTTYDAAGVLAKAVGTFGSSNASVIQSQQTITQSIAVGITSASPNITGAGLRDYMVGRTITGVGIPTGTTVLSVVKGVSAVLSNNATVTNAALTATLTLPKLEIRGNGYARITELERVVISSTDDVTNLAGNQPALRVGDTAGMHLRIDGNEILAMDSDSVQGVLNMNLGGMTIIGSGSTGTARIGTASGARPIKNLYFGIGSVDPDASGLGTFVHNLGISTNYSVFITSRANAQMRVFTVTTKNANNFIVRVNSAAATLVTAAGQTFDYLIIEW